MKNFFKKNQLLIPVIVLSVLVALFFTADNQRLRVLTSVVSARQLISEYSSKISSLTLQQKQDLIKEIDSETGAVGIEYSATSREIQNLKTDKKDLESQLSAFDSERNSLTSQIASNQNRISALRSRQENLSEQFRNRMNQCATVGVNQRANCRNQAQNINGNIAELKKQIVQAQSVVSGLQKSLSELQYKTNPITNNIKSVTLDISAKEKIAREMFTVIQSLGNLRTSVVNSTNTNNDNNDNNVVEGCTDGMASNWNSSATKDDGSCEYKKEGCTDERAKNYNQLAIDDDGSCQYEEKNECLCETGNTTEGENEAEKVTIVEVFVTWFGGVNDPNMGANEPLFVPGKMARDLNPDDIYTAWPLSDLDPNNNFNPRLGLPNVEACFGPEVNSWPKGAGDERIAKTNKALSEEYDAEISYTNKNGVKKTIRAKIEDRGPEDPKRWDASKGLLRGLGLEDAMNSDKTNPNNMVELEVKLVRKSGGSCPAGS